MKEQITKTLWVHVFTCLGGFDTGWIEDPQILLYCSEMYWPRIALSLFGGIWSTWCSGAYSGYGPMNAIRDPAQGISMECIVTAQAAITPAKGQSLDAIKFIPGMAPLIHCRNNR